MQDHWLELLSLVTSRIKYRALNISMKGRTELHVLVILNHIFPEDAIGIIPACARTFDERLQQDYNG